MKRLGNSTTTDAITKTPRDNNNEAVDVKQHQSLSILGNSKKQAEWFPLSKSITSIFNKNSFKGSLRRKKDKTQSVSRDFHNLGEFSYRSCLSPPMPPVAPTSNLKRVSSSTLSLNTRTKKKMLTLEELYVEILYTILHMIGCDANRDEQTALVMHLKEAFHMDEDKHRKLLDIASMREEPYLKANLEIFEARGLIGKDMLGSSDPFCTFYLTTNPLARFNTSYRPKTLNPTWGEEFVLDVNSIEHDFLRIDVWDFNPEENVSDKFRKISEIKDSRGLRKFLKETLNASTGMTTHDLLGSVEISLRDIPSSGIEKWYTLQKPDGKSKRPRGDIRLGLILSTEKDQNLTTQEHRHLLKILFAHELQKLQATPFAWEGSFSKESVTILAQHAVQGKLTGADTALARWLVYAHTHCDLPLNYHVFLPILEKLHFAIKNGLFHREEETRFLEVAALFIQQCIEFVRMHRHFIKEDERHYSQLECILKCLQILDDVLEIDSDSDCGYTIKKFYEDKKEQGNNNIRGQVHAAAVESIDEWYQYVYDQMPMETTRACKIKNITGLVNVLLDDLKEGCMTTHKLMQQTLHLDYICSAYEVYERQLTSICRELIETTSEKLKPVVFSENDENEYVDDTLAIGTGLFELYLALQTFAKFGHEIFKGAARATELWNNHTWFNKAVARWLDIALYKAMQRINRAVELDDLDPVDEFVQHSSSAVDIKTVLIQIRTFWQQLCWPDVETSYAYTSKILDDVCKTTIFYADQMCTRVVMETLKKPKKDVNNAMLYNNKLETIVTPHLCLAINNIDFVLQFIRPFVAELGMDDTVEKLRALDGDLVANSCKRTLTTLVHNAVENVENKILEVLDMVGEKMAPVIQKFLVEGCSIMSHSGKNTDNLINYLDSNLIMLKEKLSETNFERILTVIWESSAQSLHDTIHISIERKKPPSYFKNLLDALRVLINFFYGDKQPQDETLLKMESQLLLYSSDSAILISRYILERYKEQKSINEGEYTDGSVTIRCQLLQEHLRVEVLNARHLKPPDPRSLRLRESKYLPAQRRRLLQSSANLTRSQRNLHWVKSKFKSLASNLQMTSVQIHRNTNAGLCDPYVTLRLVPAVKLGEHPKHRTRTERRTLFPLFDETFDFVLPYGSHRLHDAYLLITVKDRGLMGNGIFLGEALLSLNDMTLGSIDQRLSELPQMQLPLTKPSGFHSDIMLALESRNLDRVAKEFLHKEKKKL